MSLYSVALINSYVIGAYYLGAARHEFVSISVQWLNVVVFIIFNFRIFSTS